MALRARPSPRCSRSRRQAEPRPRSWAHQRARAQPLHKMVRFLFRAREHAPAQPDMRIPFLHHMPHAAHPHARAYAHAASRSIALLCAVDPSLLPAHLAGHYSASFWAQTIILAATATSCSSCARWCFSFFPDRAQCSPFLSRRTLGAVA